MADIEKAMDTLSSMLSSEEGKQTLSDMVSSFTNDTGSSETSSDLFGMDTLLKVKDVMDEFQHSNDRRSNLLMALKPYLNNARLGRIDETINLLKLAKLPNLIKGIRK